MPRQDYAMLHPADDSSTSSRWSSQRSNPNLRNRNATQPENLPAPEQETGSNNGDEEVYYNAEDVGDDTSPPPSNQDSMTNRWVRENTDDVTSTTSEESNSHYDQIQLPIENILGLMGYILGYIGISNLYQNINSVWESTQNDMMPTILFMLITVWKIAVTCRIAASDIMLVSAYVCLSIVLYLRDSMLLGPTVLAISSIGKMLMMFSYHCVLYKSMEAFSDFLRLKETGSVYVWRLLNGLFCLCQAYVTIVALCSIQPLTGLSKKFVKDNTNIMCALRLLATITMYEFLAAGLLTLDQTYVFEKIRLEKEVWMQWDRYPFQLLNRFISFLASLLYVLLIYSDLRVLTNEISLLILLLLGIYIIFIYTLMIRYQH